MSPENQKALGVEISNAEARLGFVTGRTRAKSIAPSLRTLGSIILLGVLGLGPLRAQPDPKMVTEAIRQIVLESLDQEKGRELSSFSCSLPDFSGPPRSFTCEASDSEGDRFRYVIAPTEDGDAAISLVSEPPEQIAPEFLAALEVPCRAFLDDYASRDWDALWARLHPALQKIVDPESLEGMLGSLRDQSGSPGAPSLSTYGVRDGGRYELGYNVPGERSVESFRCGLHLVEGGAKVSAFLLAPPWGTPLYSQLISAEASAALTLALGAKVERVEIPFDDLPNQYDTAPSSAWLEDGSEFAVLVERSGRDDDFERLDVTVKTLDAPLLVTPYLASQDMAPRAVECPSRVIPDGGSIDCTVILEDGGSAELTVTRRGAEHRILRLERVP